MITFLLGLRLKIKWRVVNKNSITYVSGLERPLGWHELRQILWIMLMIALRTSFILILLFVRFL